MVVGYFTFFLLESPIPMTKKELPSPYLGTSRDMPFATLCLFFSQLRSLGYVDSHSSLVGYCPQEDALDDLVSVEEHLYFYARIHGIPEKDIKEVSTSLKTSSFENHYCFRSLPPTLTTDWDLENCGIFLLSGTTEAVFP